jgi:hypothetical protein
MSALGLFFLHVGFMVGTFVLSLVVGTLVFYFRKEEPSFVGCGTRFIGHTSGDQYSIGPAISAKADHEPDCDTRVIGTANKEFEDIKIVFPLRQTQWASEHVLCNSPAS